MLVFCKVMMGHVESHCHFWHNWMSLICDTIEILSHFWHIVIVIVIVNSWFLERPQKRSRRNQLIHRRLTKTKSIGRGQDPESQAGRQYLDGYGGWCLELRQGGRYGDDDESGYDLLNWNINVYEVRFWHNSSHVLFLAQLCLTKWCI